MADEPKRSSRSSSTGATRKGRTKASTAAAASSSDTAAEKAPAAKTAAGSGAAGSGAASSGATSSSATETSAAAQPAAAPTAAASAPAPQAAKPAAPAAQAAKPAAAAPAPAPAAAESGGSGGVALAGLIAGVVGIVLALTYPQWTPIVYGGSGSEDRVTADQVRTEMAGEIQTLKATIASMAEKQAGLEQSIQTAKLPGILMVAEDLHAELGGSEPYAGTLNLFRSLTGGDEEAAAIIAAVEDRAETGIPSVADLQDGFDEVAHAVLMAEQRPQASGDLAAQVSDTVASLAAATMRLRWRLDGAPTGDGVPATVARAEQAVMNGEFQLAIDTLGLLPEEREALAASWIEMVRARMNAEDVREQLDAYVISLASRIQ